MKQIFSYFFVVAILSILCLTACNNFQDPGPYGGKWRVYAAWPTISDPSIRTTLEFFDDGTMEATNNSGYEHVNFHYSNDTLFIDYNGGMYRYITSFPHSDTLFLDNDTLNNNSVPYNIHMYYRVH